MKWLNKIPRSLATAFCIWAICAICETPTFARTFYVSQYGSDIGTGDQGNPFGTLAFAASKLRDGDKLYITSDMDGSIYLAGIHNLTISGYNGVSNITSGTKFGIISDNCPGITITDLAIWGTKADAYQDGIGLWFKDETDGGNVTISNVYVNGYGGHGIGVYNYQVKEISNINILNTTARNCKWDGISVGSGEYSQILHNIIGVTIKNCIAQENPGGAVNWSHTGSGIFVSCAKNVLIRDCEAAYNGANNLNTSGGPVGIWVGDVENASIINCYSHENNSNILDGGGFDVDGGCIDVTIDSCKSESNKGAGYLVYEWATTSGFRINNVCIKNSSSTNDGINTRYSSIYLGSVSGSKISNVTISNLTINQGQGYVVQAKGTFENVSVTGNNICYTYPSQFSPFATAPAGLTISGNIFPCQVLAIDTTKPARPVPPANVYEIKAYPNPASSYVDVYVNAPHGKYDVKVFDVYGRVWDQFPVSLQGKKKIRININSYSKGFYSVVLWTGYAVQMKTTIVKL